ncbi:MAG: M48 family metalloprotease [Bacteriovoracia bacterium]
MQFFEHQRAARRSSVILVGLFLLFTAAFSAIVALGMLAALGMQGVNFVVGTSEGYALSSGGRVWFLQLSALVAAIIGGVTLVRIWMMGKSGEGIAEKLGGIRVAPDTQDPNERKLLNVVEEMSIASGVPMPAIFLLPSEAGLNAFAAGFDLERAAIGVTAGAVQYWSRDELQAVIAHEFSHILNGDMRLNLRLTGAVSGFLFLAEAGRFLLRGGSSGRRRRGRGGHGGVVAIGLVLLVLGWLGVLFARVLQAAVSRTRERLADASGAQFTRNPGALASALSKVLYGPGSAVSAPYAMTTSHFFFAEAVSSWFSGLFSSHPSFESRIRVLDPRYLDENSAKARWNQQLEASHPTLSMLEAQEPPTEGASFAVRVMKSIGEISPTQHHYGHAFAAAIPYGLRKAMETVDGSHAVLRALVGESLEAKYSHLSGAISQFTAEHGGRIELLSLALRTLKQVAATPRKEAIVREIEAAIRRDQRATHFEAVLLLVLKHSLFPGRGLNPGRRSEITIASRVDSVVILYRWLLGQSQMSPSDRNEAFQRAYAKVSTQKYTGTAGKEALTFESLERHLVHLKQLPPAWKERVLAGAVECVIFDRQVLEGEAEVFRGASLVLGVPVPPILR